MTKRKYIKVFNGNETLYFKESDLTLIEVKCFQNAGYKVEIFMGCIKRTAYIYSLERLKELKE